MWHWIKQLRDWAMNDVWTPYRIRPRSQALFYSFEKAGLTLHDQPIPWNAESVLVEASLRLPTAARRRTDFTLRWPEIAEPFVAESLTKAENDDRHRLFFRLPVPTKTIEVELHWRSHRIAQLTLSFLSQDEFLRNLRLHLPTLTVRLGDRSICATSFVANQCRGMLASAVLRSPTSLVPLIDLGLHVRFRSDRGNTFDDVPVFLSSSQLASREVLLTVQPPKVPKKMGEWSALWRLGEMILASQRIRGISKRVFYQSIRMLDARFVIGDSSGRLSVYRQLPALTQVTRVGPCFLLSSREPGIASSCTLQVYAHVHGALQPQALWEESVLLTDGPTPFVPGTVDVADLHQLTGFELRAGRTVLGVLPLSPIPEATFNSEGGFKPPSDYTWTPSAEEELAERLAKLMENPN